MRTTTLLTTLATLGASTARLTGIALPSTLAPSQPFTLTLITENYIQSVADVSVTWGYSLSPGYPYTIGSYASSAYLGPDKSNQLKNVTLQVTAPADLEMWKGKEVTFAASLFSLYGVSGTPSVSTFNVSVEVGDAVEGEEVRSQGSLPGTA